MKFDLKELPYSQFEQLGLSKKDVLNLKPQELANMLEGKRTSLLPLTINLGEGIKPVKADVKLSLSRNPDNTLSLGVHPILAKPENTIKATPEQWDKMLKGEPIIKNSKSYNGSIEPHLHQLDKQTNELLSVRLSSIELPKTILGNFLKAEQKEELKNALPVTIEDKKTKETLTIRLDLNEGMGFSISKGLDAKQSIQVSNSENPVLIPSLSKEVIANELHHQNHGQYLNNKKITEKDLSQVPDVIEGHHVSELHKKMLLIGMALGVGPVGLVVTKLMMSMETEQQQPARYLVNDKGQLVKDDVKTGISPINHSQVIFSEENTIQQKINAVAATTNNVTQGAVNTVAEIIHKIKDPITHEGLYLIHVNGRNEDDKKTTYAVHRHADVYEKVSELEKNQKIVVEKITGLNAEQKDRFFEMHKEFIGTGKVVLTGTKDNVEIKEAFLMRSFNSLNKETGNSISYSDGKQAKSTAATMKF